MSGRSYSAATESSLDNYAFNDEAALDAQYAKIAAMAAIAEYGNFDIPASIPALPPSPSLSGLPTEPVTTFPTEEFLAHLAEHGDSFSREFPDQKTILWPGFGHPPGRENSISPVSHTSDALKMGAQRAMQPSPETPDTAVYVSRVPSHVRSASVGQVSRFHYHVRSASVHSVQSAGSAPSRRPPGVPPLNLSKIVQPPLPPVESPATPPQHMLYYPDSYELTSTPESPEVVPIADIVAGPHLRPKIPDLERDHTTPMTSSSGR